MVFPITDASPQLSIGSHLDSSHRVPHGEDLPAPRLDIDLSPIREEFSNTGDVDGK